MRYLEPNPQSWLLTDLRGNLPSTFSVEAKRFNTLYIGRR
jgi:hypothetical protein